VRSTVLDVLSAGNNHARATVLHRPTLVDAICPLRHAVMNANRLKILEVRRQLATTASNSAFSRIPCRTLCSGQPANVWRGQDQRRWDTKLNAVRDGLGSLRCY
jgi:hypothetical protein